MLETSQTKERLTNIYIGLLFILLCSGSSLTIAQSILLPGSSKLERASGSMAVQAVWSTLYLGVFILLWPHRHEAWRRLKQSPWMLALIAFAFASMAWSDFPGLTLRRGIAVGCTTIVGLYLAIRYSLIDFLRILAYAMLAAAVLSVVSVMLFPEIALETYRGTHAWNGLYPHKNLLAKAMVFGVASWTVFAIKERGWKKLRAILCLGFCLFVFWNCHSASAASVLGICFVFALIGRISQHTPSNSAILFTAISFVLLLFGFLLLDIPSRHMDKFFVEWTGRDTTLTGRTVLWGILWDDIQESPLLGYGYSAYWLGERGPSEATLQMLQKQGIDEVITHSHNGYIDILLNIGAIGCGLFLIWMLRLIRRAVHLIRQSSGIEFIFPLFFITLFLVYNLSERQILLQHSLYWAVLCMIAFSLNDLESRHREKDCVNPEAAL